jgi:hypothetical protein
MRNGILSTYVAVVLALAAPLCAQQRFDSADAAAQAVIAAAEKHDSAALAAIFGPTGNGALTSGSPTQDRAEQSEFAQLARTKYQLVPDQRNSNRMILSIGDEDWPFPVPVVRANGQWSFDASETKAELRARRIGGNELSAIAACAAYVEAQRQYASEDRDKDGVLEYAPHMMSVADDAVMPQGLAEATWEGQKSSATPYRGYYFRILRGQGPHAAGGAHSYLVNNNKLMGGFGLLAWPAQYGVTGIQTYMVNQDGVVYQKDIALPAGGVPSITRYDPDPSWTAVD